jgi:hypothetical protein
LAERRMFAREIIDSDPFLDMPLSSQALYFHLGMNADDDGFINNPKRIIRTIGCSNDDFKLLIAKRFVIIFDSGVMVITHWKRHNFIRTDRYKETIYKEEKEKLLLAEDKSYKLVDTTGIPDDNQRYPQVRLGKVSIDKKNTFVPALEAEASPPASNPVISFLLNDGSQYNVTENDITRYRELYPGIDVMQELRNLTGWCEANPKNRKTRNGAKRFITGWLTRAQNRAPAIRQKPEVKSNRFHNFEQRSYDYDDLLHQIQDRQ